MQDKELAKEIIYKVEDIISSPRRIHVSVYQDWDKGLCFYNFYRVISPVKIELLNPYLMLLHNTAPCDTLNQLIKEVARLQKEYSSTKLKSAIAMRCPAEYLQDIQDKLHRVKIFTNSNVTQYNYIQ